MYADPQKPQRGEKSPWETAALVLLAVFCGLTLQAAIWMSGYWQSPISEPMLPPAQWRPETKPPRGETQPPAERGEDFRPSVSPRREGGDRERSDTARLTGGRS